MSKILLMFNLLQQPSLSPKTLGSAMDSQQANQATTTNAHAHTQSC